MNQIEKIFEGKSFILDLSNPNKASKQLKEVLSGIFSATGVSRAYLNERDSREEATATKEKVETKTDYIGREVELNKHPVYQNGLKATIKDVVDEDTYSLILKHFEVEFEATTDQFILLKEEFNLKGTTTEGYEENIGEYFIKFGDNKAEVTLEENSFNAQEVIVDYSADKFKVLSKYYRDHIRLAVKTVLEDAKLELLRNKTNEIEKQLIKDYEEMAKTDKSLEDMWNKMFNEYEEQSEE